MRWQSLSQLLSPSEEEAIRALFGESLDLLTLRVSFDHPLSWGAPKVLGRHLCLQTDWGGPLRAEGGWTERGWRILMHELVHAWQHQNGSWAYAMDSLLDQLSALAREGSRSGAYRWQRRLPGSPWSDWGPEEQAQAIEDSLRPELLSAEQRRCLKAARQALREGRGARRWSQRGAWLGVLLSLVLLLALGAGSLVLAPLMVWLSAGAPAGSLNWAASHR